MMTTDQTRPVADFADDYDWEAAANEAGLSWNNVDVVLRASEGERDEESWIATLRMKDERFAFLSAWCDYTGWDCQAGGTIVYADTIDTLIIGHIGDEERARLGYAQPVHGDAP